MLKELKMQSLHKSYKKKQVVRGVSFSVKQGEIIGILGPNGAGKTTSFYMAVGLIVPDKGNIYLNSEDITRYPMYQRSRLGISYLPQEASVFRKLSSENNIMSILEFYIPDFKKRLERLEEILDKLNIQHIRKSLGYQLSGGERRRVEIGRALASNPSFLLLDEPFAGVDPIAVEEIQAIIIELQNLGLGILITDHNAKETLRITTRSYILTEGSIKFSGTSKELSANQEVRSVYLGENFLL